MVIGHAYYTPRTPLPARTPTAHSRTRFVARARSRSQTLARMLHAILAQKYNGTLEILMPAANSQAGQQEPDDALAHEGPRPVDAGRYISLAAARRLARLLT